MSLLEAAMRADRVGASWKENAWRMYSTTLSKQRRAPGDRPTLELLRRLGCFFLRLSSWRFQVSSPRGSIRTLWPRWPTTTLDKPTAGYSAAPFEDYQGIATTLITAAARCAPGRTRRFRLSAWPISEAPSPHIPLLHPLRRPSIAWV